MDLEGGRWGKGGEGVNGSGRGAGGGGVKRPRAVLGEAAVNMML